MIRAFTAWSWLVAVTGTAVMVAPHLPLLVAQRSVIATKRAVSTSDAVVRPVRSTHGLKAVSGE